MQIKIFNIPIGSEDKQVEEMNHFLRANKIVDIRKELAMLNGNGCWSFCITYMQDSRPSENEQPRRGNGGKVDYKDVLPEDVFARFSDLRKIRKQIAENEAVPAFAVFTDAELAEMAKLSELTSEGMKRIPGIGNRKVEKYLELFLQTNTDTQDETDRVLDGKDSGSGQPLSSL